MNKFQIDSEYYYIINNLNEYVQARDDYLSGWYYNPNNLIDNAKFIEKGLYIFNLHDDNDLILTAEYINNKILYRCIYLLINYKVYKLENKLSENKHYLNKMKVLMNS